MSLIKTSLILIAICFTIKAEKPFVAIVVTSSVLCITFLALNVINVLFSSMSSEMLLKFLIG